MTHRNLHTTDAKAPNGFTGREAPVETGSSIGGAQLRILL